MKRTDSFKAAVIRLFTFHIDLDGLVNKLLWKSRRVCHVVENTIFLCGESSFIWIPTNFFQTTWMIFIHLTIDARSDHIEQIKILPICLFMLPHASFWPVTREKRFENCFCTVLSCKKLKIRLPKLVFRFSHRKIFRSSIFVRPKFLHYFTVV